MRDRDLVLHTLLKLRRIARDGRPAVYAKWDDFFCDFWSDLPWDADGCKAVLAQILTHPRFAGLASLILRRQRVDFFRYLRESLRRYPDHDGSTAQVSEDERRQAHLMRVCGFDGAPPLIIVGDDD